MSVIVGMFVKRASNSLGHMGARPQGDLYGENVGALPGGFIILLCLCHGDLNGEQPFMGSSVSYLLNGETITAFLFASVQTELALLSYHL